MNHGTDHYLPRSLRPDRVARASLAGVTARASWDLRATGGVVRGPPRLASGRTTGAARLSTAACPPHCWLTGTTENEKHAIGEPATHVIYWNQQPRSEHREGQYLAGRDRGRICYRGPGAGLPDPARLAPYAAGPAHRHRRRAFRRPASRTAARSLL